MDQSASRPLSGGTVVDVYLRFQGLAMWWRAVCHAEKTQQQHRGHAFRKVGTVSLRISHPPLSDVCPLPMYPPKCGRISDHTFSITVWEGVPLRTAVLIPTWNRSSTALGAAILVPLILPSAHWSTIWQTWVYESSLLSPFLGLYFPSWTPVEQICMINCAPNSRDLQKTA